MRYPVYIVATFAADCLLSSARKAGAENEKSDIPEEEMWFR